MSKAGLLSRAPVFPERLDEAPPRQGFFEHAEYLKVREHPPPDYQDVLDVAYWTGWRRREATGLLWSEVDLDGGAIRLGPERSKAKAGRVLPLAPPLRNVLARRLVTRQEGCPLVFHQARQPIVDWRMRWARACKKAGLSGKLLHDCRRTAARNLVRAGVPERVAMALLGHKTRSVFDRYNITSEGDLRQAAGKLADYLGGIAGAPTQRTRRGQERREPAQFPHSRPLSGQEKGG